MRKFAKHVVECARARAVNLTDEKHRVGFLCRRREHAVAHNLKEACAVRAAILDPARDFDQTVQRTRTARADCRRSRIRERCADDLRRACRARCLDDLRLWAVPQEEVAALCDGLRV